MPGDALRNEDVRGGVDLRRPGREFGDQVLADAFDLPLRVPISPPR